MDETRAAIEEDDSAEATRPTIPAHPRPGTRTFVATTADQGRYRLSRVGLTLDDVVDEELADYQCGLIAKHKAVSADSPEAMAYASEQPDITVWEAERCLALIRPSPGGDPDVYRFDGSDSGWPMPLPSTVSERVVWSFVKDHGAEACREVLTDAFLNRNRPELATLSKEERMAVEFIRSHGSKLATDRLFLAGEYGFIAGVFDRLGSDAVGELRRIIAAGRIDEASEPAVG